MIIKNVSVFGEDHVFHPGEIRIKDGVFVSTSEGSGDASEELIDGEGCYAIPGLIDIHFHGCVGHDFCDGTLEALEAIATYEASVGVTAIAPASMTLSAEELEGIMRTAASYAANPVKGGADLVGINMEGPFISPSKKGAQAAKHIIPCNVELFRHLQKQANGLIKLVDIAPEEPGAMEFIDAVKDEVAVSVAHTAANYDIAKEAYDRGARHATHLYNTMPPFSHREPGVVGAVHDSKHAMAELICDGIHIHPATVRATFDMLGADRMVLISDSMRAAGMPDGQYTLGGQDVTVNGNRATLVSDGNLAGSVTNLMDCVRTAVKEMGIPLETAITCATINPAKAIGIDDRYGSIAPGKVGHVVLLDKELRLKKVIL